MIVGPALEFARYHISYLVKCPRPVLAEAGANVIEVSHQRTFSDLPVKATLLQLVIETRDRAHRDEVLARLNAAGFRVRS